ncbi:MAG: TetR family transcriptional regulator [Thermoleophilia bacterium]
MAASDSAAGGDPLPLRERNRRRVREEIGATAHRLFLAEGYDRVSVERVAREAGVSPRTVFRHFPHKEDLVFHRHADMVERLEALLDAAPAHTPSLAVLAESLAQVIGFDAMGPEEAAGLLRLLETEPELGRYEERLSSDHRDAVARFLARRLAGTPGGTARAELLAGAFHGAMAAARRNAHADPSRPPAEHFADAIALLDGLAFP